MVVSDIEHFVKLFEEAVVDYKVQDVRSFKIVFKVGAPVCVTTPWISFDGLLAHLVLLDVFGQDFFVTPKKFDLTQFLQRCRDYVLPLVKTEDVYHASVSMFVPYSVRVTQIYKRFEERWGDTLKAKNIRLGSGYFRMYAIKEPYVPCKEVVFYVCGDMEKVSRLIEKYLIGLGNDVRIGFGVIRDVFFEETIEDFSLVANGVAMRPIPVSMCSEYDDVAYLPYKAPYWNPKNVTLCVPPGVRCRLKDEYQRGFERMG